MLSENFIASIQTATKSSSTAISKDVGIYLHELQPTPTIKSSFKKSSTSVNTVAVSSSHIFAAQADKAVVHVYSRERGNQEALISFPERIHSVTLIGDGILALGTSEGRVILWEVSTGRQVTTPAAHLQAVSCLASTELDLVSGSEDSNIHVWSVPQLISISANETHEPLRSLSNHRAAITSLVLGHSSSTTNICVSCSRDNTVIIWNYLSGDLLRTFLLPSTPLCATLDPCDRAAYVGFEDGSVQLVEFIQPTSTLNPLYDTKLQNTPVQLTTSPWSTPSEMGPALCIGLNYDGTILISGHASGKISQWDTGRRCFWAEIAALASPVTNLILLSPFQQKRMTKLATVVKPKIGGGNYTFTSQLLGSMGNSAFDSAVIDFGFPSPLLEDAITRFSSPVTTTSSSGDEGLKKENEELWQIINEQSALQKKTWDKYTKLKTRGG